MNDRDKEIDIMARTIYGEARSEGLLGMEAVASVIMNRVRYARDKDGKHWWGNTVSEVCLKPYQFSCWLDSDANSKIIKVVDESNAVFRMCKRVAARAFSGVLKDATKRADHYHTKAVNPKWAVDKVPVAEIGGHLFYRLEI